MDLWRWIWDFLHIFLFESCHSFSQSTALDEEEIFRMSELNSLFDTLHKNFDFRINKALRNQTSYLRIINAQLFSRVGFVKDEIKFKEMEVLRAIQRRGQEIGNQEAECIVEARMGIENSVEYAGYNINGINGETMFFVNQVENDYFYPLIHVLQFQSNLMQSTIISEIHRYNPVTQASRSIERLESDYEVLLVLYDISIRNIEREMSAMDDHMNDIKASMFPQLNSVRDYFNFTANIIRDNLPLCTA